MRSITRAGLLTVTALLLPTQAQGPKSYVADIETLFEEIDAHYPFFDAKGIRKIWQDAKKEFLSRAKKAKDDVAFILVVQDALSALRDGHASFKEVKPKMPEPLPEFYPGLAFLPATEGRVVVIAAPAPIKDELPVGTIVQKIEGQGAREYLNKRGQASWERGGPFSSPQRASFFEYRLALRGARGTKCRLDVLVDKKARKVDVEANQRVQGWVHLWNVPEGLTQAGKSVGYVRLAGGAAYVYLRRVDESVPAGLATAMSACANAPGWIIDLRGNSGGGYDDALISEIKKMTGPVAVLIDSGCISAGETLARDFKNHAKATLLGETTAGSSTQKREFRLPSGLATLQFSIKSRFGSSGSAIEFNGIKPDIPVEAVPEEIRSGKDSLILRAEEFLLRGK